MNILLADLDKLFVQGILDTWSLQEAELISVSKAEDLIPIIESNSINFAFIGVDLLLHNNMDMVSFLKEKQPGIDIIVLCDSKSVPAAESAISRGAHSYLLKPITREVLETTARKFQTQWRHKSTSRLMEDHVLDSLLGDTPEMRKILKTLYKIAPTTSTVLITGESGSGKEFLANIIHRLSKRADDPFVAVNCGAIPENIVESELFGSKKGAYTGSVADKKGLFETAAGGTLFLDEIGELSPATQVKLLRFLQNHEIRRVGETENRYLDVRIIAATNQDLQKAMEKNEFREDLYYRLNTFHIHLPPLRERQIVIPRLIKYFSLKYKDEHGKSIQSIDPAAQMALSIYNYPGNIRELENIVEHAIVLSENGIIRLEDLPESVRHFSMGPQTFLPRSKETTEESLTNSYSDDTIIPLNEMERQHIIRALNLLNGNKTDVATKLGISRATLWRKLKEHKIELNDKEP